MTESVDPEVKFRCDTEVVHLPEMARIDDLARVVERIDERTILQWKFGTVVAASLCVWPPVR
jgi:hypothetical protein